MCIICLPVVKMSYVIYFNYKHITLAAFIDIQLENKLCKTIDYEILYCVMTTKCVYCLGYIRYFLLVHKHGQQFLV